MTTRKPSFYARVSSLIVVQVLFVFSALALLLLAPGQSAQSGDRLMDTRMSVHATCDAASELYASLDDTRIENLSETVRAKLERIMASNKIIQAARIYQIENGRLVAQEPLLNKDEVAWSVLESLDSRSEGTHLHQLTGNNFQDSHEEPRSTIIGDKYLIESVMVRDKGDRQTVIVAVAEHGMFISSRSYLHYHIWLLFLASVLVSLLTIYLITVRVKQPMTRLLRNLRKTATGETYHFMEDNKDAELNELIDSFNQLSRRLMLSHNRLSDYSRRATEMNVDLLRSHLFLATLINSSPYPIIATGLDGRIMLANENAISEMGYPEAEMIELSLTKLLALPSGLDLRKIQNEAKANGFEARCQRQNGSSFPAFIIASPIGIDGSAPEGWLYIIRDITDSKSFQDMMIRLDRYYTRGEMAGDIAHDINNFLAILSGNIELMPILLKKNDPEKIEKKLTLMKDTVDKIALFADGLMDTPPDKVRLEPSDLNQVLENVIAFIKPLKRLRGVEIKLELSGKLPLVPLDRPQVQQVMTNLIVNAAEAITDQEGDHHIRVSTSVVESDSGRLARIEVADNGPGVAKEHLDDLFEKRFTTRRKGHGIGLITCRKIVDAHHGTIGYTFSEGALFYCELPIEPVSTEVDNEQPTKPESVSVG